MTYLSVRNFWKYQNADVWKKSRIHPPWYKQFVHPDRELDKLPTPARLLFVELLKSATRHSNVLEADLYWICGETRMTHEEVSEMLPLLLKGGWLSQTKGVRRSRKPSRQNLEDSLPQEVDVELELQKQRPRAVRFKVDAQPSDIAQMIELSLEGSRETADA